jgi:gas vesicle protein
VGTIKAIQVLATNPPKDFNSLKSALESLGTDILVDSSIATNILNLERKYLLRSREVVKVLCDSKKIKDSKFAPKLEKVKTTLEKNQSFILLGFKMLNEELKKFVAWIKKKIKKVVDAIKVKLQAIRSKVEKQAEDEAKKYIEKKVNLEAPIMSAVMGLAARALWTGAAGVQHVSLNIGAFKPMKAKSTEGASAMIREMAKGFEAQLTVMSGLVIPPANTGIPPLPFTGYK